MPHHENEEAMASNNLAITPLDPRYGSGVVNVYNSYENLIAGEHAATGATSLPVNAVPVANLVGPVESSLEGWNLAAISTTIGNNQLNHYAFDLTGGAHTLWNLNATLDWNVTWAGGTLKMPHYYLYLLNTSGQLAWSQSAIDNVQQLDLTGLTPGEYDLAVMELGSATAANPVGDYALAWNFTAVPEPRTMFFVLLGAGVFLWPRRRYAKCNGSAGRTWRKF